MVLVYGSKQAKTVVMDVMKGNAKKKWGKWIAMKAPLMKTQDLEIKAQGKILKKGEMKIKGTKLSSAQEKTRVSQDIDERNNEKKRMHKKEW